jgi:hypothetical protein
MITPGLSPHQRGPTRPPQRASRHRRTASRGGVSVGEGSRRTCSTARRGRPCAGAQAGGGRGGDRVGDDFCAASISSARIRQPQLPPRRRVPRGAR